MMVLMMQYHSNNKSCTKCGEEKGISGFYKRSASKDGLTTMCRVCIREQVKRYSLTTEGRITGNKAKQRYIDKNPVKRASHVMVSEAIRSGKLIREPCEYCSRLGAIPHHDDYAKPMDVRWLCPTCHKEWHKIEGEAPNG